MTIRSYACSHGVATGALQFRTSPLNGRWRGRFVCGGWFAWTVALALLSGGGLGRTAWGAEAHDAAGHGDAAHAEDPSEGHAATGEHGADAHGEGAAHGASANPLTVDPDLAIVTAIVFLVLMLILWKFAWGPISAALDQRERSVADNIAAAERNHESAKQLLSAHQAKLDGAADEVRRLLEMARKEAEEHKQQVFGEAQAAARSEKDRALREIGVAKQQALQELAEKSVDTAVGLASRIVKAKLNPQDHSRLIQDALDQMPSQN